jgi:hypothetical protein
MAMEKVPDLDNITLGIFYVYRAVTAVVLDRSPHFDILASQSFCHSIQFTRVRGEREVHMSTSPVTELLLPGSPQPEAGRVADREPNAVLISAEHLEAE